MKTCMLLCAFFLELMKTFMLLCAFFLGGINSVIEVEELQELRQHGQKLNSTAPKSAAVQPRKCHAIIGNASDSLETDLVFEGAVVF